MPLCTSLFRRKYTHIAEVDLHLHCLLQTWHVDTKKICTFVRPAVLLWLAVWLYGNGAALYGWRSPSFCLYMSGDGGLIGEKGITKYVIPFSIPLLSMSVVEVLSACGSGMGAAQSFGVRLRRCARSVWLCVPRSQYHTTPRP